MKDNMFKDHCQGIFHDDTKDSQDKKTGVKSGAKAKSSTHSSHSASTPKTTSHAKSAGTPKAKKSTSHTAHKPTASRSKQSDPYSSTDYVLVEEIVVIEEEEF